MSAGCGVLPNLKPNKMQCNNVATHPSLHIDIRYKLSVVITDPKEKTLVGIMTYRLLCTYCIFFSQKTEITNGEREYMIGKKFLFFFFKAIARVRTA